MTFEETFAKICKDENIRLHGDYAKDIVDNCRRAYQAGAASRDTEIQRLQFALADSEALELGTAERCDQLRAQINVLRESLEYCVTQVGELATVPGIASALSSTPEQSLAAYRNKVIEQMIACYSPDDSAHDYFDKLNALKGQS